MDTNLPSETPEPVQPEMPDAVHPEKPEPIQAEAPEAVPPKPAASDPFALNFGAKSEKEKKTILIVAIAIGIGLLCCVTIFCVVAIVLLARGNSSDSDQKPPHYGVFLKIDGDLVELDEDEFFGLPDERELRNLESVSDEKPTILVWRKETQLQYLQFFYISDRDELSYNATPREDGVIEIQPKTNLENGAYCLIQGNPIASGLPGWCFEVK